MSEDANGSASRVMSRALFTEGAIAYAAFDDRELLRLKRFVRQVDRLRSFSFFAHPAHRMRGTFVSGVVVDLRADSPSDEAISAVMPPFRELYNEPNPTSGDRILKLLGHHAYGGHGEQREAVLSSLRSIRKEIEWRRRHDPRGSLLEEDRHGVFVARTPRSVIDAWLNGEYFHFDEEKALELVEGEPATEMMKTTLLSAIHYFANLWAHARNAVVIALRSPGPPDD